MKAIRSLQKVISREAVRISLSFATVLIACNPQSTKSQTDSSEIFFIENSDHKTEKIIGEKDLIPVNADGENLPLELRPFISAIGQLNVGCTATHVGKGFVLTAGHCILSSPRASTSNCRHLSVVWGHRANNTALTVSKCLAVKARVATTTQDFALIEVSTPPPTALEIDFESSEIPRAATMLSFPRMRPLEWSGDCVMTIYNNPDLILSKFLHTCDSESGSSGAPLIARDSLKIVGVHGGSSDELNYGTLTSSMRSLQNIIKVKQGN